MSATLQENRPVSNETAKPTGNRCGHDSQNPVFLVARPNDEFLREAADRMPRLYGSTDWRLWMGRRRKPSQGGGIFERPLPRTELREAIVRVGQFLCLFVQKTDRLRVVRFKTRKGVAVQTIAAACGLSLSRTKRALQAMAQADLIGGFQPREKTAAGYRGREAVRWLRPRFLKTLGLWSRYQAFRKWKGLAPMRDRSRFPARAIAWQLPAPPFAAAGVRIQV